MAQLRHEVAGDVFQAMTARQDDNRHIEPTLADERYQRRGSALQALAAPIDDNAPNGGIRADDKLGIVVPPGTDRRVTEPLDLGQDVAQPRTFKVGLVEVASAYQELEVARVFHPYSQRQHTLAVLQLCYHPNVDARSLKIPNTPRQGSGANSRDEQERFPFAAVETSSPKHRVPDLRRSPALNAQTSSPNCPFRMRCINSMPAIVIAAFLKFFKAEHHSNALLYTPMVLLDQVVQVFRRAQLGVRGQPAIGF